MKHKHHTTPRSKFGKLRKIEQVMKEFKMGKLRSGSGGKVVKKRQAIAVALNMAGMSRNKRRGRGK